MTMSGLIDNSRIYLFIVASSKLNIIAFYIKLMVNMLKCIFEFYGAVAQLGERDVRNVEVRGSIPLSSIFPKYFQRPFLE